MARHRSMMKELLSKTKELAKSSNKVLNLERKISGLNRDLMSVIAEKDGLKKTAASLKSTNEKSKAAVNSQLEAKLSHQRCMAKIRLKKERVSLAREEAKKRTKKINAKKIQMRRGAASNAWPTRGQITKTKMQSAKNLQNG